MIDGVGGEAANLLQYLLGSRNGLGVFLWKKLGERQVSDEISHSSCECRVQFNGAFQCRPVALVFPDSLPCYGYLQRDETQISRHVLGRNNRQLANVLRRQRGVHCRRDSARDLGLHVEDVGCG